MKQAGQDPVDHSVRPTVNGVAVALTTDGASVSLTEVEIDFGYGVTKREQTFTITDATVTPSTKITAWQSGNGPTGKNADDNEMEMFVCNAVAGSGQFLLNVACIVGLFLAGKYKVHYLRG